MHAWLSSIHVKKAICCDGFSRFMYRSTISFIVFILSSMRVCNSFSSERVSCRLRRCSWIRPFAPRIAFCCSGVNYAINRDRRTHFHFAANQRPNAILFQNGVGEVLLRENAQFADVVADRLHRRYVALLVLVPIRDQRLRQLRHDSSQTSPRLWGATRSSDGPGGILQCGDAPGRSLANSRCSSRSSSAATP